MSCGDNRHAHILLKRWRSAASQRWRIHILCNDYNSTMCTRLPLSKRVEGAHAPASADFAFAWLLRPSEASEA